MIWASSFKKHTLCLSAIPFAARKLLSQLPKTDIKRSRIPEIDVLQYPDDGKREGQACLVLFKKL
jgi:hypothetical protein